MPPWRDPDRPVRQYLRRDHPLSIQGVFLVVCAELPIAMVAPMLRFTVSALERKVQRARASAEITAEMMARGSLLRLEVLSALLTRYPPPRSTVLWFGATTTISARSFALLCGALGAATRTLDVCMFSWTSRPLGDLAIQLLARGVRVRAMVCRTRAFGQGTQVPRLREAGALVLAVSGRTVRSLVHHKYAVVDDAVVIDGSFNWSDAAARVNSEHVAIHPMPGLAREFAYQFRIDLRAALLAGNDGDEEEMPRFASS